MLLSSQGAVSLTYAHDRRAHRHRCRCCGRIINEGESVIMARVADRTTWAVHESCGERRHSAEYSWREILDVWAKEKAGK